MRRSPKSDPQREQLYRMEKRGLPGLSRCQFTRKDHATLTRELCRAFDIDQPQIALTPATNFAGLYVPGDEGEARIYLSTKYASGRSPMTLVHELAHHVVYRADPDEHLAPHGQEFVGIYGDMLSMAGLIPWSGWRSLCESYKVRCVDTDAIRTTQGLQRLVKKRATEVALKCAPLTKTRS